MIMTYQETLEWMFNKLPMYQRIGAAAYKADLNNTIQLLDLLDNPHHSFKSVHVAGTNGKGSVSHTLASVFQEAGYKTGWPPFFRKRATKQAFTPRPTCATSANASTSTGR